MMHVYSNMSPEEILKYCVDDSNPAHELIAALAERVVDLERQLKIEERNYEVTHEQACFGRDLVETILNVVNSETRAKEMKKEILSAVENSYFEI